VIVETGLLQLGTCVCISTKKANKTFASCVWVVVTGYQEPSEFALSKSGRRHQALDNALTVPWESGNSVRKV
jgi:hypothetical protein